MLYWLRDGPLKKLWGEWGIFEPQEFFSLSNSLYEFVLGRIFFRVNWRAWIFFVYFPLAWIFFCTSPAPSPPPISFLMVRPLGFGRSILPQSRINFTLLACLAGRDTQEVFWWCWICPNTERRFKVIAIFARHLQCRYSQAKATFSFSAKTYTVLNELGLQRESYTTPKVTKYQRFNFMIQIHQFTIKINKININLLFECVKIVDLISIRSCFMSCFGFSPSRKQKLINCRLPSWF